ncbi:MAG: NifB/NifX family molybdenum-iron cluster-binding protein [Bacteroidales bacterium]|jgi:predicted Fe-Mo cluster-binding NifX family protein|nr:NifB/NifX family molybdenum-iron cluster-binding protein [Bacteroidales bacterium]MCI2122073.1 NifB/NifX family molybdenum-iron cluster-binding protein [Bacteroidales bacterium]MCI2146312.1 NifB/NifX family molybdenum-iron cluster-binding protein [Bacteroidales bacterium]
MKIAIASENDGMNSTVDGRFGRCPYFAFHDTSTGKTEFVRNPARESSEGAGPAAVEFVASRGTGLVMAGDFGTKIRSLLDGLGISMEKVTGKTVAEAIKSISINHPE